MKSSKRIARSMDEFPDVVLVEILCRLPCRKIVFQCKCVSKRWQTLLSDPYFVSRFVGLQSEFHRHTPKTTLINCRGMEFLNRMPNNPLKPFLKNLKIKENLEKEPSVYATYNDLLLCGVGEFHKRSYYVCNPFSQEATPLPPPPRCRRSTKALKEGFVCDLLPYYKYTKHNPAQVENLDYRYRVVRTILASRPREKVKVQIFCSEVCEWRESILVPEDLGAIGDGRGYPRSYNGRLYWTVDYGACILELDPFIIDNKKDAKTTKCLITDMKDVREDLSFTIMCLGTYRWGLKVVEEKDIGLGKDLLVFGFTEEEMCGGLEEDDSSKNYESYGIESDMKVQYIALDPSDEYVLYLNVGAKPVMFDLGTRMFQDISEKRFKSLCHYGLPLVLPWWPTPVRMLPQLARLKRKRASCVNRSYALRSGGKID